jgi:import inner membrane translocase subunit TIM22
MESCAVKTAISGVLGGGMGMAFGMFMFSMGGDLGYDPEAMSKKPLREQMRSMGKEMRIRAVASGRNLAVVGAAFAGSECIIETVSSGDY